MAELQNWIAANKFLLLLASGFLLGLACAFYLALLFRRWLGGRHRKKGRKAEKKAVKLLQKRGFRVLERDPAFASELLVDDHVTRFPVTPDLLVERDGQRFVVEIKSYRDNISIQTASIRRQVLEYLWASGLPCLLVTMPEGNIEMVDFADRSGGALADDMGEFDQVEGG